MESDRLTGWKEALTWALQLTDMEEIRKPIVDISDLRADGKIFFILARIRDTLKKEYGSGVAAEFIAETYKCVNVDSLLKTAEKYVIII